MRHLPLSARCVSLLAVLVISPLCHAQQQVDYNSYYRFPVSIGVEYQMLTPFAAYARTFNVFEADLSLRVPIPPVPFLQPMLQAGLMRFDSLDLADPLKWDHTHYYGGLGLTLAHRFAKNFEVAAEILGGLSESVYLDLVADAEAPSVGQLAVFGQVGAKLVLDPSYSFSIEVHPNVRYLYALGPLHDFDGFIFGIGFSGQFRFGQDPDAAAAIIRAIRFDEVTIPGAFAAMQSYYTKEPLGKVRITNTERQPLRDVQVSFVQPKYMDSPTVCATIPELKAGESREVELHATFSDEVFKTEGVTPLTGDVVVAYTLRQRAVEQRQPVSYDLHDKTAIVWDDDRKAAAFITPQDSALRNYASFIRAACKEATAPGVSEPLQYAVQLFHALGELGCLYQADPTAPFTSFQGNAQSVDSVSLPRDTLKRGTGDCDDLTVLYCSMLEAVGIESAFVTVPGHIYAAVNTGVDGRDWAKVHPDRGMTIVAAGKVWVPVEITMIGKGTFLEAWRRAVEEYAALDGDPAKRRLYLTKDAHEVYRSVVLKETDLGLQYGSKQNIVRGFEGDMGSLVDLLIGQTKQETEKGGTAKALNKLGILYAQYGRYDKAETVLRQALTADAGYVNAEINLANVLFLKKDYQRALAGFQGCLDRLAAAQQGQGAAAQKLLVSISKTYYQLERYDEATASFAKAWAIDAEKVKEFAYLGQRAGGGSGTGAAASEGRAAGAQDLSREVLFAEEEQQ